MSLKNDLFSKQVQSKENKSIQQSGVKKDLVKDALQYAAKRIYQDEPVKIALSKIKSANYKSYERALECQALVIFCTSSNRIVRKYCLQKHCRQCSIMRSNEMEKKYFLKFQGRQLEHTTLTTTHITKEEYKSTDKEFRKFLSNVIRIFRRKGEPIHGIWSIEDTINAEGLIHHHIHIVHTKIDRFFYADKYPEIVEKDCKKQGNKIIEMHVKHFGKRASIWSQNVKRIKAEDIREVIKYACKPHKSPTVIVGETTKEYEVRALAEYKIFIDTYDKILTMSKGKKSSAPFGDLIDTKEEIPQYEIDFETGELLKINSVQDNELDEETEEEEKIELNQSTEIPPGLLTDPGKWTVGKHDWYTENGNPVSGYQPTKKHKRKHNKEMKYVDQI